MDLFRSWGNPEEKYSVVERCKCRANPVPLPCPTEGDFAIRPAESL